MHCVTLVKMVKLYLILNDIVIPILIGFLITLFISAGFMHSYLLYSFTLVTFSLIKGFYNDYYYIHFSEKLRISFISSFTVIFAEMIYFSFYSLSINSFVLLSWIIIPIVILQVRYFFRKINQSTNYFSISIIGNLYKFNDLEIGGGSTVVYEHQIKFLKTDVLKSNETLIDNENHWIKNYYS